MIIHKMQRERTKSMRKFSNIARFSIARFSSKTCMWFTIGTRFITIYGSR